MSTWDGFSEDVKARDGGRRTVCSVGAMLAGLDGEAVKAINAVMDDPSLSSRAIRLALLSRLHLDVPSLWTINRHRRKDCACRPEGT